MNGSAERAARYRHFAEQCIALIERLPADVQTRAQLTEMAKAWLELAQLELQATPG
jgi:hypothetical protein